MREGEVPEPRTRYLVLVLACPPHKTQRSHCTTSARCPETPAAPWAGCRHSFGGKRAFTEGVIRITL
eukprot:1703163-Prymnesium_polylepis.1